MIHQQPFSMGAAYAGDGVKYWSWDGGVDSKYGSVTLTDFGPTDHGFGGYIHEDGGVRRYDIDLLRVPGVSGHMLVQDGWVYVADTGNARVIRFKADSGTDDGPVKPAKYWREPYELGYNRWVGTVWQVVAGRGAGDDLVAPSGLAMSPDGLRLFVSDAATQDIVAYSVDAPPDTAALDGVTGRFGANTPQLSSLLPFRVIGRIHTPASQIQGLAYDTVSARLFYVDAVANRLVVVNPDCPGSGHDVGEGGSRPAADAGSCSCPDDSAQAGCTAPMDPAEPSQRLYDKFVGANFDGCARQFYDKCPGGACRLKALRCSAPARLTDALLRGSDCAWSLCAGAVLQSRPGELRGHHRHLPVRTHRLFVPSALRNSARASAGARTALRLTASTRTLPVRARAQRTPL